MDTRGWLRYFEVNAGQVLRPAPEAYTLTPDERARIAGSIRGFQIGEASEGRHLKSGALELARRTGNTDYPKAITCLVREENRHSAYLGAFMRHHGLPFAKTTWTDEVFRALRRAAGIELSLRVLVTAELVAVTYYDCLSAATGSRMLKTICRRMLDEEARHIEFQMHHVHWMNLQGSLLRAAAANIAHAVLMAGTLVAVWIEHRRVLRVKHGFWGFARRVFGDFIAAMHAGAASALETMGEPASDLPLVAPRRAA
jgi:hypothetical protein